MGIVNLDVTSLRNGMQLQNAYVTLSCGPLPFPLLPAPLKFSYVFDSAGAKSFVADVTYYTYTSKANKDAGFAPIQEDVVTLDASDFAGFAFAAMYAHIQQQVFTHSTDDDGRDTD